LAGLFKALLEEKGGVREWRMHDAGCTMLDAGLMDYWIDGLLD
jgi:hypothetical protein